MTSPRTLPAPVAGLLAGALAVLLVVTLPSTAGAYQVIQELHPEGEEGKGWSRDQTFQEDAEYSTQFGIHHIAHWAPEDHPDAVNEDAPEGGFNADVWVHNDVAYLGSWGNPLGNVDEDGELTGEAPFCPSQGVRAVDISDPSNPQHLSTFADAGAGEGLEGSWTEKVVVQDLSTEAFTGTLAAVSAQICDIQAGTDALAGFVLYDVTDPAEPELLATVESLVDGPSDGSHEIFLEARDGAAYVYTAEILQEQATGDPEADEPGTPDMRIFDVSDPTDPEWIGDWGVWQDEGIQPISPDEHGFMRTRFVHSLIVSDEVAYLSYWDRGTVLLDVSDPSSPELISSVAVPGAEQLWSKGSFHSAWLGWDGDLLIENPEVFNPAPETAEATPEGEIRTEQAFGYPRFTDISNPSQPTPVGGFEMDSTRMDFEDLPPGDWTTHDPKIRPGLPGAAQEDFVYFSWYSEGVPVVSISDVIAASDLAQGVTAGEEDALVAQFMPDPREDPFALFQEEGVAFPFIWGVFLHETAAGERYAVASDINSGLWLFSLDACPPGQVPGHSFADVPPGSAHDATIACALHAGITVGRTATTFAPAEPVTRAQMSSFIARSLAASGFALPAPGPGFPDVAADNVHADNINRLAAAGIVLGRADGTFGPNETVRRDQTASFLVRAVEWATGRSLEAPAAPFDDRDAIPEAHRTNVDIAFDLGLVLGRPGNVYEPAADTRRDQMASVVTRMLNPFEFRTS